MWLDGPTAVDVLTRVTSGNDVTSPVSGSKAAFVHVELLEAIDLGATYTTLGEVIFGDRVSLAIEGHALAIEIVARRVTLSFVTVRTNPMPMDHVLAELAPFLARARGGTICHREHLVLHGATLRLRAVVERATRAVDARYPSDGAERLFVRDELGPVRLDEVLEGLSF